jgi:iron(III) transport system substrate-binding protein
MIKRRPIGHVVVCSAFLVLVATLPGCGESDQPASAPAGPTLTVYTSVDQPYARPILQEFEKQTGIRVRLVTDTEATKSVGLAERLRAERANPQCDVWWGNEVFHTINLAVEGMFKPYRSPVISEMEEIYVDREHRWAGNAVRARVIAVSTADGQPPYSPARLEDLLNPALKDRIAMARPTAGTTGGHVSAMWVVWGEQRARDYFMQLRENGIRLVGGNAQVADNVGRGTFLAGLTDNDDITSAQAEGLGLVQVVPDQQDGGLGTLTIPTTVALVAGRPDSDAARQLVDYLLSRQVEEKLISMGFAGYSVRKDSPSHIRAMQVDYADIARVMPTATREATGILEGR